MSDQRFCDYCGVDTRGRHSEACPGPALDELRRRIESLEDGLVDRLERYEAALQQVADSDPLFDANPDVFALHAYRRHQSVARAALSPAGQPEAVKR